MPYYSCRILLHYYTYNITLIGNIIRQQAAGLREKPWELTPSIDLEFQLEALFLMLLLFVAIALWGL